MAKTGLVYHTLYLRHDTGEHPEGHKRLAVILNCLEKYHILEKLIPISPREATIEELQLIHDLKHIEQIKDFSEKGGGHWDEETIVSKETYKAGLLSAGGVLAALDCVMAGQVDNAFALVRPPGQHALRDKAQGFCFFNNVAIAAKYAINKYNLERILIIDMDAHIGKGIQKEFYDDSKVLTFSIHQEGSLPFKGLSNEVGIGDGEGYSVSVPVPKETGDAGFKYAYSKILEPIADQFKPQLILIACGVDGHFFDYMSNLELTTNGYAMMMEKIKAIAEKHCQGRIVAALEGGYNYEALGPSITTIINVLGDFGAKVEDSILPPVNVFKPAAKLMIDEAIEVQKKYWNI